MNKTILLFLISIILTIDIDFECQKDYILNMHNFYRKLHQSDDLMISNELEKIAQDSADYLIEKRNKKEKEVKTKNTYMGEKLGENRYWGIGADELGFRAIYSWFNEENIYFKHLNNPKYYPECERFTQVVWKSSKIIGCGMSCDNEDFCVLVCNYYPAGNIINEYSSNVFPKRMITDEEKKESKSKLEEKPDSHFENFENALEAFRKEITERHNYYRKRHYVGNLERDSNLEEIAQISSEYMLETDSISYLYEKFKGDFLGQSVFYSFDSLNGQQIVDKWYEEINHYDFGRQHSKKNKSAIHFTNIIWKDTQKIGCGFSCKGKECFGCCLYYPNDSY